MNKEKEDDSGEAKNFCLFCNIVFDEKRCPMCRSKKVRAVTDEDFCFAGRVSRFFGDNLKFNLESENIDCVLMPFGSGLYMPSEEYLVYVRYKNLKSVREIIKNKDG